MISGPKPLFCLEKSPGRRVDFITVSAEALAKEENLFGEYIKNETPPYPKTWRGTCSLRWWERSQVVMLERRLTPAGTLRQ